MANIASPNIIKASDINDLTINTLTTSGNITCNGNLSVPNGNVTANMYYGRKFLSKPLYQDANISNGTWGNKSLSQSYATFEYLDVYCLFTDNTFDQRFINVNFFNSISYSLYNAEFWLYFKSPVTSTFSLAFRLGSDNTSVIRIYSSYGIKYFCIYGVY